MAVLDWITPDAGLALEGEGVRLRPPRMADFAEWAELRAASRAFLQPWEPSWPADDLTRAAFRRRLSVYNRDLDGGGGYPFFIFRQSDGRLCGGVNLRDVRRGVSWSGALGYWAGAACARQGHTLAAVRAVCDFAFERLGLNRLEAACVPDNLASRGLLEKAGFAHEGMARSFLKIDGAWRDHLLFARLKAPPTVQEAAPQASLRRDAREALARGEIEPFFQPIVELATGRVAGFEALARWRHPRLGLIPPDDFLPLLAEAGLLGALGRRMLAAAAAQLAAWRARRPDLFISVNLTAPELERPQLVAEVAALIKGAGLPPRALKLELTEGEVMRDPEASAAVMHALRDAGAGVAIDDFGIGFSSLSRLTRLPVEVLKIDRYFVSVMGASAEAAAVIRSIVGLARDLGLDIVAEGVEGPETAAALAALGCRYGQGFAFAPPLSAAAAATLLEARPLAAG